MTCVAGTVRSIWFARGAIAMNKANLSELFRSLQAELSTKLATSRRSIRHAGAKGSATEQHWRLLLEAYLPNRYEVRKGFVIDSEQSMSDEIDLIIHDRHYSPFVLRQGDVDFVPAESVYAVVEVKQKIDDSTIGYAAKKAASVRALTRTSVAIPHAGGRYEPRTPPPVVAALVALDSWPADKFRANVSRGLAASRSGLDLGCAVEKGAFNVLDSRKRSQRIEFHAAETALVFFLFRLMERLRAMATAPALDFKAYGRYL
jgi:hypothetical protein